MSVYVGVEGGLVNQKYEPANSKISTECKNIPIA